MLPEGDPIPGRAIIKTDRTGIEARPQLPGLAIQMHIELDPALSLTRAHEVSDAVEADILAAYPHAEIIIHQDPAGVEMPEPLAQS